MLRIIFDTVFYYNDFNSYKTNYFALKYSYAGIRPISKSTLHNTGI
ncbi:hypothetical protein M3215_06590 [Bacillus cytotoxicus]|uniref:Uncharacterized protein n=1 Tax=Bacillus cytotoxicus TaxID=580165 RepID=A0ACC6A463_9BACI|nr:hypothetical protein [Bacillus cytotoxicus]